MESAVQALDLHSIVSDVIRAPFKPQGALTIQYDSSDVVSMGNDLAISATQKKPTFQFTSCSPQFEVKKNDLFTLVMTDPDAPSRVDHKWSEYCHYVTTNLDMSTAQNCACKPDCSKECISCKLGCGDELMSYIGPAPPQGTGKHRYVFLLYKQPSGLTSFTDIKDRPNWGYGTPATGVEKWASENNLELIAANFFYAENK